MVGVLIMMDLHDVQRAVENKFGEIIGIEIIGGEIIGGEIVGGESMFAIKRPGYRGEAGHDFMTIRYHENGGFYGGTYDITRARAMAYLCAFGERVHKAARHHSSVPPEPEMSKPAQGNAQ